MPKCKRDVSIIAKFSNLYISIFFPFPVQNVHTEKTTKHNKKKKMKLKEKRSIDCSSDEGTSVVQGASVQDEIVAKMSEIVTEQLKQNAEQQMKQNAEMYKLIKDSFINPKSTPFQ